MRQSLLRLGLATLLALVPAGAAWSQPHSIRLDPKSEEGLHWVTQATDLTLNKKALDDLFAKDPNQTVLKVGWPGFSDPYMKNVVRLKKLTHLTIGNAPVHNLADYDRENIRVTAKGWRQLHELKDLRVLKVRDVALDDDSFAEIGKLTELTTLYLEGKVSEAGVKKLMNLKKLTVLILLEAQVTDACAKDMAELTELQYLSISKTSISDEGLKHLAKLSKLRRLGLVSNNITDAGLKELDDAGVKGVRFNFIKRLVDSTPKDVMQRIATRIAKFGWHIVVYFEMPDLPEFEDFFTALPTTVVVDHMGTPDVKKGVDHPENQRFIRLMEQHQNFWVKATCPERMTIAGPPYDDVVPFGRTLVERFPDRVLWGTDWPHPNMKNVAPDDGQLVDHIPRIAPTATLQQKLLVDNPMRLYWS